MDIPVFCLDSLYCPQWAGQHLAQVICETVVDSVMVYNISEGIWLKKWCEWTGMICSSQHPNPPLTGWTL